MAWLDTESFESRIRELTPELTGIRHDIHRHPELGFEEQRTQALVRSFLERHGYTPRDSARTGLVADLRPDLAGTGADIALRADIDCLPMTETTDLPYRSVHEGRAHKCGHDGHTSILLGVAALLAEHRERAPANVRLLFQPAEEGVDGGGARVMVQEGVLDGVKEIYGLHNWPGFPRGEVRVRGGPMLAQVHSFRLRIVGVGGHGSQPQICRDPIVAGAHMVTALQTVVARGLGYEGGAVVSVTSFQAGTTDNVIPAEAILLGTIRSFEPAVIERVTSRFREVLEGTAAALGVSVEIQLETGYPVLMNDPQCATAVKRIATALVGEARVLEDGLPIAGGEDFAYFANERPGAYFLLGARRPGEATPVCHHPDFDFDDELIPLGIRMFLGLCAERL